MDGAASKAVGAHATRQSDSATAAPEADSKRAQRADEGAAAATGEEVGNGTADVDGQIAGGAAPAADPTDEPIDA
jgi:hypothetical protein